MADVHEPGVRSYNMSRIRSKDTAPEMVVRRFLHAHGFRYGLHNKKLPGTPDMVFRSFKTALFVHGCFWHGHDDCQYYVVPKTRTDWWLNKIGRNKANDLRRVREIKKLGWRVISVFECELKPARKQKTLTKLLRRLQKISEATP